MQIGAQLLTTPTHSFPVPFSVPIGIWIDKDLRLSTIFSIALVALGSVLRCFALDASETSIVLLHLSYICNGELCAGSSLAPSSPTQLFFIPPQASPGQ